MKCSNDMSRFFFIILFSLVSVFETKAENTDIDNIDNVIYVVSTSHENSEFAELSICMKNTVPIRGFQFNMYLPDGVKPLKNATGKIQAKLGSERLKDNDEHTLSVSEQKDGGLLFLCGSQYDEKFSEGNGEIASLKIVISDNLKNGDYPIVLKNIKNIETDISKCYVTDIIESKLTVVYSPTVDDYIPGDVNGDNEVLIDDVVNTINYVLGDIPDNFVFAAADMNADDTILIDDVVQVINAAMRINESKQHVVQQQRTYSETLYVSPVALHDGAKNYSLRLNNAGNYAAMQFDMTMPAGVDIEQMRTLVPNSHSVALRKIDGNSVRAVVASLGNEVFGTEEVVQLSYSSSAVGSVNISNAYASTPDGMIVKIKDAAFGNDMTGIKDINITTIVPSDIYDMSGRVVRKNAISVDGLKKGIYIMDGKKVVVE